jgi:hypothetical protein
VSPRTRKPAKPEVGVPAGDADLELTLEAAEISHRAYQAVIAARRLNPRQDDREILALLVSYRMMKEGPDVLKPAWSAIFEIARNKLFGISDNGVPTGRMLKQMMGDRRRCGPHSWVGISKGQRPILQAEEHAAAPLDRTAQAGTWRVHHRQLALLGVIIEIAFSEMLRLWGHLSPEKLLAMARVGKLGTITFQVAKKVTERVGEIIERETPKVSFDATTNDRDDPAGSSVPLWNFLRFAPGSNAATVGPRTHPYLDVVMDIERAFDQVQSEPQRRHLLKLLDVLVARGPRATVRDVALATALSPAGAYKVMQTAAKIFQQQVNKSDPGMDRSH